MDAERYAKIKEIFQGVIESPPDERPRALDKACDGDGELRREVERLLNSYESGYLEQPAAQGLAEAIVADELPAGAAVGHYTIVRKIGSGGMGDVYLGEDGKLGRKVALKFLPDVHAADHDRLNRFQREARAASALNHPNILTIFEIGEDGQRQYIATEYIDGETLRARMNRERITVSEALDIAVQCASALAAAHEAGIVHRDIKPENIMLRRDGLVKILDFGLAKLAETKAPASVSHDAPTERHIKTAPGMIMGTAQYMSPEQTRGHATDARTDIWSLGVVIYEMLAGTPPFKGDTSADIIAEIVKTDPAPLSTLDPQLPGRLDEILAKALEKKPDDRYQTVKDLLRDIRDLKRRIDLDSESKDFPASQSEENDFDTTGPAKKIDTIRGATVTDKGAKETVSGAEFIVSGIIRHKWSALGISTVILLLLASAGLGTYYLLQSKADNVVETVRVTTTGKAQTSAISNDGQFVAYSVNELGNWSLWVKHMSTQQSTQIISPSDSMFGKLVFSADGNYIYYTRSIPDVSRYGIHVVPVMGGTQRKVAETWSLDSFDISRTDDRVVFVRIAEGRSELAVINADGTGEKTILTHPSIESPTWTRKDERIAFVSIDYSNETRTSSIVEVDTEDVTSETTVPIQKLFEISSLTWIPDNSGFLMIAKDGEMSDRQVWKVNFPEGSPRRVTNDFGDYNGLSLTGDRGKFVSVRSVESRGIWVAETGDFERAKQITFGSGIDGQMGIVWRSNGQIVYTSYSGNGHNIWTMDGNGSNQKQLTFSGNNVEPSISADDRYIAFVSDRTGTLNIWRMDADGNNPIQITHEVPGRFPQISPDGNWVIYQSFWDRGTESLPVLWKVPIVGGKSEQLTDTLSERPAISPNGKLIAFFSEDGISTMPFEGGAQLQILKIAATIGVPLYRTQFYRVEPYFRWLPDSSGLIYVTREGLWKVRMDGKVPLRLSEFDGERSYWDLSKDGLKMAYGRSAGTTSDVIMVSDWR